MKLGNVSLFLSNATTPTGRCRRKKHKGNFKGAASLISCCFQKEKGVWAAAPLASNNITVLCCLNEHFTLV